MKYLLVLMMFAFANQNAGNTGVAVSRSTAITVVNQSYLSKDECERAGEEFRIKNSDRYFYSCITAP